MIRTILFFALLSMLSPAAARMYQWTEPGNGKTHLSGHPPAWYRNGDAGPRVFVFRQGQLIDDTGIEVSDQMRRILRQQALMEVANNPAAASGQAQPLAAGLNPPLPAAGPPPLPVNATPPPAEVAATVETAAAKASQTGDEQELTPEQIAELRALVADWEAQSESAPQVKTATSQVESAVQSETMAGDVAGSAPAITREQLLDYLEHKLGEHKLDGRQPAP